MRSFIFTLCVLLLYCGIALGENEDVKNASCSFDEDTFCNWINFDDYWKTGEDVELDPIHSIMNSPTGVGKFAFIQKEPANDQPGFLVSPELNTPPESTTKVIFYYRKNTNSPILDICVTRGDITQLRCIESVSDKGPQQWILKNIRLPVQTEPFKIVFRVRNMRSIMDVVAIDDIIIETVPNNNGRMTVIKSQKGTASSNINSGLIKQIPTQQSGIEFDVQPAAVTRAVSRTTPPASRFNVGEFPSFANGVDIFIPDIGKGCKAIRCSFMKDNCFWSIGKSWKRIDANLAVELPGTDSITSGFFLVPLGSFFEFDLWMSDTATIVVYQNVEGKQNNLFNRKGGLTNNGWHRFRIPLQASFSPSSVSLQSLIGRNDFITISNVKLVNGNGEEVSCESVQTETPLETKNPYVKTDNPFTIQRDSPILTRLNGQPAVFPINNNVSPLKPIKPMKYGDFERLTSLQKATMTGENMNRPRIYPLSAVTELPNNNPQVDSNSMPDLMKLTQHIPTEWKNQFMKSLTPDDTLKPKSPFGDNEPPKQQPNMGLLLSQIGGNPVLENQLKQLAQRFGFTGIQDPRAIEMFHKFVSSPALNQKLMEAISNGGNTVRNSMLTNKDGIQPIIPINVDAKDFERVFKEQSMKENLYEMQRNQGMSGELLKNVVNIIKMPSSRINDEKGLTRDKLDFAIQSSLSNNAN